MAPLATKASRARIGVLLQSLGPAPGRLEQATRVALVCALVVLVVEMFRVPEPALITYVVFFLVRTDRTSSIIASVAITLIVTLVIALVLAVAIAVVDHPPWRVASMALISLAMLFLTSASKLRPVGAILALVVGYGLDLLGTIPAGEAATRGLLYGWLFVGIPAGVAVVVNLALAPSPRHMIQRTLARRASLAAELLSAPGPDASDRFAQCLADGNAEVLNWLRLAAAERSVPPNDITALRAAADNSLALLSVVDFLTRTEGVGLACEARHALARTLAQMAKIFDAGGYPVGITLEAPIQPLSELAQPAYATITALLTQFADPGASASEAPEPPAANGLRFFLPDAFSNPNHLRYALKTTAAAMGCYLLYSVLAWPGIHTCLITCYIVSLETVADSVEKLSLRLAGCLAGSVLGLVVMVFVIPDMTNISALSTMVFFGALAAAWVAVGNARISYAGFQMAFAFFLCVVQGASPSFDMVTARDRVIGILVGNLAVYLVSAHCWPVSVSGRIEAGIAELWRLLARMMLAADAAQRRAFAAQVHAALDAVRDDIGLARREPASLRPGDAWLGDRLAVVHELAGLEGPLLIAAEQGAAAGLTHRLARLAGEPLSDAPDAASAAQACVALRSLIEHKLRALEEAAGAPRADAERAYAPA